MRRCGRSTSTFLMQVNVGCKGAVCSVIGSLARCCLMHSALFCADCGSVEVFHSGSSQLVGITQVCTVLSKAARVRLAEDPVRI